MTCTVLKVDTLIDWYNRKFIKLSEKGASIEKHAKLLIKFNKKYNAILDIESENWG